MSESIEELKRRIQELESALRRSDEYFSQALAQGHAAVYRRNFLTDRFDFVSESVEQITGCPAHDFTPQLWDSLVEHVELIGKEADVDADEMIGKYRTGEIDTWHAECRFKDTSGKTRWIMDLSSAIHDETSGELIGSLGIMQDITGLKEIELREKALQERLDRSKRIESIGRLAGAVAHDLNNILVPIVAYPAMIIGDVEEGSLSQDFARQIEKAGQRAAAVISDLMAMAHHEVTDVHPVNLGFIVDAALESQGVHEACLRSSEVTVKQDVPVDIPAVLGSEKTLTKIIANLIVNAYDFMPEGGQLSMTARVVRIERGDAHGLKPGSYVAMRFSDTGLGITPDDCDRIFEPFYTKKLLGRGINGLGLAASYGLAEEVGGLITVESALGKGSTFTLFLAAASHTHTAKKREVQDLTGTETVLVVDDDEAARTAATNFMDRYGYNVLSAVNGHDALTCIQKHGPEKIDIMLLDMIMEEGFDGLDTFRAVREIAPTMKCIIVSGFSETDRVREVLELGAGQLVRKPFSFEDLGRAVRQTLDSH